MAKPSKDKNIDVPEEVLRSLLTPAEMRMLKNRWQIIQHLGEGLSVRAIAEKVKVGTDTVVRVSKMQKDGFKKEKLTKILPFKTRTPWIFGKSE